MRRCRQLVRAYGNDSRFFESRARLLAAKEPWIVFDEIHKRGNWRDILKGAYDIFQDDFRFLITGSARLDLFRKSGDSLVGRYNLFNLMPLSMPSLARDLEVAHTSVKSWLEQLKRLYILFDVLPWHKKISRGLKKGKKWYFLDWYYVPEHAARLENMVAANLCRYCLAMTDMGYGKYTLHYVRTLDKKEIDFLVVKDDHPLMAVEVKTGNTAVSPTLLNRSKWFGNTPTIGVQVVDHPNILKKYPENTWVMSITRFLNMLL